MANTLRGVYDTDVLIAAANSFTGSVLAADYTENMAASMIMPNDLRAYRRTMNGAELTETVRAFVEGCEGRLYAVQPRLSAGGQRHRHRGQRRKTAALR